MWRLSEYDKFKDFRVDTLNIQGFPSRGSAMKNPPANARGKGDTH